MEPIDPVTVYKSALWSSGTSGISPVAFLDPIRLELGRARFLSSAYWRGSGNALGNSHPVTELDCPVGTAAHSPRLSDIRPGATWFQGQDSYYCGPAVFSGDNVTGVTDSASKLSLRCGPEWIHILHYLFHLMIG